jgi:hypothetical protein
MASRLLCFARGVDDRWEAICLTLDIAVQGNSFEAVKRGLDHAIRDYVDGLSEESPRDRARLLNRHAPWHVYLSVFLELSAYRIYQLFHPFADVNEHRERQDYAFHCHA